MKHKIVGVALTAAAAAGLASAPLQAQIPVTDVAHMGFTQNQTIQDWVIWLNELEQWRRQFEALADPKYQNVQETLEFMVGNLNYEDARTLFHRGPRKSFEATFTDLLAIRCPPGTEWRGDFELAQGDAIKDWLWAGEAAGWTGPEFECVPADTWNDYWRKVAHDTWQGAFGGTFALAFATEQEEEELDELRAQLHGASGDVQAIQAMGYIMASQLESTRRLTEQLAILTQIEAAEAAYGQVAQETTINTLREMMFYEGWDGEIVYENYPEVTSPWSQPAAALAGYGSE